MKVLVLGAGEVGFHLAQRLSEENQDVVLIEADPDRAGLAAQQLDVLTVVGNGASLPVLEEAGIRDAEMLLCVTSKDEVNLIASMAGKRMGVRYAVARISNPEYYGDESVLPGDQMGIDLMINPERECAQETFDLLRSEIATDFATFAGGRVQLVGLRVRDNAPVAGRTIAQLAQEIGDHRFSVVAITRGTDTYIPKPDSTILAGDQIYLLSPKGKIDQIAPLAGYGRSRLQRVMIAGGSKEGEYLAEILESEGVACTILDHDRRRCVELAEKLPLSLVLHADATDLELLEMEGVAGLDGYVAATNHDETNLLSSLLAKSVGAQKVVSLVHKFEYLPLVPRVGIDASVSPRMSAVNAILRYVRRGRVAAVTNLTATDAEVVEYTVHEKARIVGQSLRSAGLPKGAVIGTILRDEEIILPRGDDTVLVGDDAIVFLLPECRAEVEALFA